MRAEFVESVLAELVSGKIIDPSASLLAVCAGMAERDLFEKMGFSTVVLSNLDNRMQEQDFTPFTWDYQDAQALSYADNSFETVFVADGLHHCASPHRAMLEMYRVATRCIIVIESRDSYTMRLANRLGLSPEYEIEAVVGNDYVSGGMNNTPIPNFIYRWTEAEFKKTIQSFHPVGRHVFRFFYGLNLPYEAAKLKKSRWKFFMLQIARPFLKWMTLLFKKQCNSFAMVAQKPGDLWPWLVMEKQELTINRVYVDRYYRTRPR